MQIKITSNFRNVESCETIPSLKNKTDCNSDKRYWPSKILVKFIGFTFKVHQYTNQRFPKFPSDQSTTKFRAYLYYNPVLDEKRYLAKFLTETAFHPGKYGIMGNGIQGEIKETSKPMG